MWRRSKQEWRCWRPRLRSPRLLYCCDGVQYAPLLGASSGSFGVSPFRSTFARPNPSASRSKQMIFSLITLLHAHSQTSASPSGGPRLRFPRLLDSAAGCSTLHSSEPAAEHSGVSPFTSLSCQTGCAQQRPAGAARNRNGVAGALDCVSRASSTAVTGCSTLHYAEPAAEHSGSHRSDQRACRPDPSASRSKQMIHSLIDRCRVHADISQSEWGYCHCNYSSSFAQQRFSTSDAGCRHARAASCWQ